MQTFNPLFNNYSKPTTTVDKVNVNYFQLSVTHEGGGHRKTRLLCYISHVQCVLDPNYG